MAKIFISYSHSDRQLLSSIVQPLQERGHQCLYDDVILETGKNYADALSDALATADGTIFLFTANSVESQYVSKEYGAAESLANRGEQFLIPIVQPGVKLPDFASARRYLLSNDPKLMDQIEKTIQDFFAKRQTQNPPIPNAPLNEAPPPSTFNQPTQTGGPNFWFLKINPDTWKIDQFQQAFLNKEEFYFSSYTAITERIDYNNFIQAKPGDKAIGYAFGDKQAICCAFVVTAGIHPTKEAGEVISLNLERVLQPSIPLQFFASLIPFNDKLKAEDPERLFPIPEATFKAILNSDHETLVTEDRLIGHYTTEGDHASTKDQLSFHADIASFGTIICLETVNPPLAIGLFGNWGSGKSFFMEKMIEFINDLGKSNEKRFLHRVVQVKFNSWHYSDANLWASLMSEIFDSLAKFAEEDGTADEIGKLSASLELTNAHKEEIIRKKNELEDQVTVLKKRQQAKRDRLEDISGLKLLQTALTDPAIKQDLAQLKDKNVDEIKAHLGEVDGYIKQLQSFWGTVQLFFKELVGLKGNRWWWTIGLAVLIFIISYLFTHQFSWDLHALTEWISAKTAILAVLMGKVTEALLSCGAIFKKINERWQSLRKTLQSRPVAGDAELNAREQELVEVTSSLQVIEASIDKTQKELDDIFTGRKLLEFIDTRSRDGLYTNQLGLISSVRKDFQTLDKLLREQHQTRNSSQKPIENPKKVTLKIDRIVLYIDDLDRCKEDVVVRVLEAIHLLLAFPLFVVVVGVDPRWLNNALNNSFEKQFGQNGHPDNRLPITSYDYLEKIFQIPFILKDITPEDRSRLLNYLVRDEIVKPAIADHPIPPPAGSNPVSPGGSNPVDPGDIPPPSPDAVASPTPEDQRQVLENVTFTEDEMKYMDSISGMFGRTPRMMNRYVNICRIIKSHKSYHVTKPSSLRDYKSTLFALGVIVGCPIKAKEFVTLLGATSEESMANFIATLEDKELKKFITDHTDKNAVADLSTTILKRNLKLISRFSFRTLDLVDNPNTPASGTEQSAVANSSQPIAK